MKDDNNKIQQRRRRFDVHRALILVTVAALIAACGGGGGGGDNEPPSKPATPEEAVERSSRIAVSTVVSLTTTLSGAETNPGENGTSSALRTTALSRRAPTFATASSRRTLDSVRDASIAAFTGLGRNTTDPAVEEMVASPVDAAPSADEARAEDCVSCDEGGRICGSCSERAGSTTVGTSFSNCRLVDEETGSALVANGEVSVTIDAGGVCDSGEIPDDARITTRLHKFSAAVTDAAGNVVADVRAELTTTVDPQGEGCAGSDRTESLDGSLTVVAPPDGVNVSIDATNLTLEVASSGFPCVERITANGGIDLDDRARGQRFSQTFDNFRVTLTEEEDVSIVATLDGSMHVNCAGNITLETSVPIRLEPGAVCPSDGVLEVSRDDGANGRIQFTATGGVEIDQNADGTIDKALSDCRDASLSQCQQ